MAEFGENIAVGRAYIGVRVPYVKLAAPGLEERSGFCHRVLRNAVTEWLKPADR